MTPGARGAIDTDWLGVERLESRLMLAGDMDSESVSFKVTGDNNLTVTGNREDNCISIQVQDGNIAVNWEDTGISAFDLNNLTIRSRGGDDIINLEGETEAAAGEAARGLEGLNVGGKLTIVTGSGDDEINLHRVTVQGRTSVRSGADEDVLVVNRSVFLGRTSVAMGGGDDMVCVALGSNDVIEAGGGGGFTVTFGDKLTVRMGGGDDQLNVGTIGGTGAQTGPGGLDTVNLGSSTLLNGGGGTDFLTVAGELVDPDDVNIDGLTISAFEAAVAPM